MAAIVLAASVGAVAKFCPQDLKLEHNRSHVAAATTTVAPPAAAEPAPPIITPMAVTTVEAPAMPEPAPPAKKVTRGRRAATKPAASAAASASAPAAPAASADAVPDNPYEQASAPGAYGF